MVKSNSQHMPNDGVAPHDGAAPSTAGQNPAAPVSPGVGPAPDAVTAPASGGASEAGAAASGAGAAASGAQAAQASPGGGGGSAALPKPDLGFEFTVVGKPKPFQEPQLTELFPSDPWSIPARSEVDHALIPVIASPEIVAPPPDPVWADRVRGFARGAVWALPASAIAFSVSFLWSAPRPHDPPLGASPGTWLVVTAFALALAVIGAVALTAMIVPTEGRGWALTGMVLAIVGTVVYAPSLGVIALARPAVEHVGDRFSGDFELDLASGPVLRWISVGGLVLLASGWVLMACAIVASKALNRSDAYLILAAVALAVVAGAFAQPLLIIAGLAMLAAGLGLAWTIGRTAPSFR